MVVPGRALLIALLAVIVSSPDVEAFTLSPIRVGRGPEAPRSLAAGKSVRMARFNDPIYDR